MNPPLLECQGFQADGVACDTGILLFPSGVALVEI